MLTRLFADLYAQLLHPLTDTSALCSQILYSLALGEECHQRRTFLAFTTARMVVSETAALKLAAHESKRCRAPLLSHPHMVIGSFIFWSSFALRFFSRD